MKKSILIISIISLSFCTSLSTNVGMLIGKNKAAFGFSSNNIIIPNDPSEGRKIETYRTFHGSILFKYGLEFSFGTYPGNADEKLYSRYYGFSYYVKNKNSGLGFHVTKVYDSIYESIKGKEAKVYGFSYYINNEYEKDIYTKKKKKKRRRKKSFNFKLNIKPVPYFKYSLTQYYIGRNLQLITFGNFITISKFLLSMEYTVAFMTWQGLYNNKGTIALKIGVFLD